MAFCEQCGATLSPGLRFCEECGAAVECEEEHKASEDSTSAIAGTSNDIFKSVDWEKSWSKVAASVAGDELGLIITRECALLDQIGKHDAKMESAYNGMINAYVAAAKKRGVSYYYLNLDDCAFYKGNGDIGSVVGALKKVIDIARPKYLMILGNEEVIDVARWKNLASDGDEIVESDLCYSTLDLNTPWDGQEYDFSQIMRVGRIPSFEGEGLESFSRYFEDAAKYIGGMKDVVPYGLSALVWEDESNDEYKEVTKGKVDASPSVTKNDVDKRIPSRANLLFFNLHGSDNTEFWYGQEGHSYPEAFAPSVLDGLVNPYFIGVEACYGAKYIGGLSPTKSIVMMALRNKCMALLGSSKIAFGTSRPKGSCADIVVGDYIKYLVKGYSAGDAHIEGLKRLAADRASMDDADVKTLAEFAIYGDPSARMGENNCAVGMKSLITGFGGAPKGLHIPMPDVRCAVQMALAEVDAKIEAVIDDYVLQNMMPDLKQIGLNVVDQKIFKMTNTGLNQKMYRQRLGNVTRVAKVYFDDKGRITKAIMSK